jgi:hypothetical protein
MVWRLLIGQHPTWGMGAFVTKAGIDVFSSNKFDFMFSTMFENLQVLQTGAVVLPGAYSPQTWVTITFPNVGYLPMAMFSNSTYEMYIEYLSNTSLRVRRVSPISESGSGITLTTDVVMNYCIFKMPIP